MMKEISKTVVNEVVCLTLEELSTRKCSLEELQSALVQLINVVNLNAKNSYKPPIRFNM